MILYSQLHYNDKDVFSCESIGTLDKISLALINFDGSSIVGRLKYKKVL